MRQSCEGTAAASVVRFFDGPGARTCVTVIGAVNQIMVSGKFGEDNMPILEDDQLIFRFPGIAPDSEFAIDFQRTLRIPDTDRDYPLPPGFGRFPVRHVEDYTALPAAARARGGVVLPIWQAEAMWLNFTYRGEVGANLPVAVKIAAGKINAVTGETWASPLNREPQDYLVCPDQPWLDGFAVDKGMIRQFVAMPMAGGYSIEEQVTGEAEWGGLQISVTPMRASAWELLRRNEFRSFLGLREETGIFRQDLGLGAGGRIRQAIYPDPHDFADWDMRSTQRVFVTLWQAENWPLIAKEQAPTRAPTAKEYEQAGLPWFDYYAPDRTALEGSDVLGATKSVCTLLEEETGQPILGEKDVEYGRPVRIGPGATNMHGPETNGDW